VASNSISRGDPAGLDGTVLPGVPGLPIYIPPVAIPGTKENQDFVDAVNGLAAQIGDGLSNLADKIKEACTNMHRVHTVAATGIKVDVRQPMPHL
jgi:hypothetical protein